MKNEVFLMAVLCYAHSIQIVHEAPPEKRSIDEGLNTTIPTEELKSPTATMPTDELKTPTATMPTDEFKQDSIERVVNKFGINLIKSMMTNTENRNIVVSPVSVAGLLAMTLLGSTGATYNEISQLIGFSQDILKNREYHEDFGVLLHDLSNNDTKTLYANAVFVDRRATLRDIYRTYLERVYSGEALPADFADGTAAKELINDWVRKHTNSKIEHFLEQPLPVETRAVLLTALYFNGQWAEPFVPEHTRKLPFNTPTKEVMVDLMASFSQFNYVFSYEDGLQMIQFPYNDSATSMYVIKPRFPKRMNLTQMMDRLDYDKIDSLISQLTMKKCVVRFPKMQLNSKVNLKDTLRAMGAEAMFTPGAANFAIMLENSGNMEEVEDNLITRINNGDGETRSLKDLVDRIPNPGVHVDSVLHQVKITINEYGTEAVAATSAVMARTAEMFYTDSPFLMFIRNDRTKLITFSAVVYDPTAN